MRRHLLTLAVAALLGSLLANVASACCFKKRACAQPCAQPCPVPAPCIEPAPCAPVKKCGLFGGHKLLGRCHKAQPVCYTPAPCAYPAPQVWVAPSGQVPSGQY